MVTDKQAKKIIKLRRKGMSQMSIADKCNLDVKTVRKYLNSDKLPSQMKKRHDWNTHADAFCDEWPYVCELLKNNPGLQAKTVFEHLQTQYPGKYQDGKLRTLQRRIKRWRATEGPEKEIFFPQEHIPGKLCASDFTDMNDLGITIAGHPFKHKLYHFVLTYSNWEHGTVCFSENFESLRAGLQKALWGLGGVPIEHRTDRLSAAVNNLSNLEEFTAGYHELLNHYGMRGCMTQPASPHENGDVEQSHYRYKTAIDQALMLRGSRNFDTRESYERFIAMHFEKRNKNRLVRLNEELSKLRALPVRRIEDFTEEKVSVGHFSTIRIKKRTYSVHSRLRGETVTVRIYPDTLEVYYGQKRVETIKRLSGAKDHHIDYRHVISWLIRKPGAFEQYKYRDDMYPTVNFRIAYDVLKESMGRHAVGEYLKILKRAADEGQDTVEAALSSLLTEDKEISDEAVACMMKSEERREAYEIVADPEVNLTSYDDLLETRVEAFV